MPRPKIYKYNVFIDRKTNMLVVLHSDAGINDGMERIYQSNKGDDVLSFLEEYLFESIEKLTDYSSFDEVKHYPHFAVLVSPSYESYPDDDEDE